MRKLLLLSLVFITGAIFIGRLFYLQVYQDESDSLESDNAIRKVYQYPKRGYIYDRSGTLLVANQPTYDVVVVPREVEKLDTVLFCSLLDIDKSQFLKSYNRAKRYSPRLPSVFLSHLSKEDYAFLSEKLRKFKGFYVQKRAVRDYQTEIGANVLGYIAEVNPDNISTDGYYKLGDLIGKQGVEKSYEKDLRGIKGVKYIQKDIYNRDIGSYKNGQFDTLPMPGKNITLTIDATLQEY